MALVQSDSEARLKVLRLDGRKLLFGEARHSSLPLVAACAGKTGVLITQPAPLVSDAGHAGLRKATLAWKRAVQGSMAASAGEKGTAWLRL